MEWALVAFVLLGIGSTYCGVKLIQRGTRHPPEPPIPPARTVSAEGVDRAVAKAEQLVTRGTRKVGRGLAVGFGVGLIAAPWLFIYALYKIFKSFNDLDMTKGRVLRIRDRAQLPELARGEGWAGDAIELGLPLSALERRVLGALWLLTARMEHASIAAFSQLGLHLASLGAPARLLEAAHRAALDEIRHARAAFAVARAITGEPHAAGPIRALAGAGAGSPPVDLTRLAVGSLVDGCLGEGIAADVAARSSELAEEPALREILAMIARDEAGHAELAWEVLAWTLAEGGPAVHRAVQVRVDALAREAAPRLPDIPGLDDASLARHGVLGQDALGALARARIAAVQLRARRLLAGSEQPLAHAA